MKTRCAKRATKGVVLFVGVLEKLHSNPLKIGASKIERKKNEKIVKFYNPLKIGASKIAKLRRQTASSFYNPLKIGASKINASNTNKG